MICSCDCCLGICDCCFTVEDLDWDDFYDDEETDS